MSRIDQLRTFYGLLERLDARVGGRRVLGQCDGRMPWPTRGVYFLFEPNEERSTTGSGLRVTRVGTHAITGRSSTTLWSRLRQHRGTLGGAAPGGGNHRGSILRLHIGDALAARHGISCPTWGLGSSASRGIREQERGLEQLVSRYIARMPVLWLPIEGLGNERQLRAWVEVNTIALLSNLDREVIDPPSESWLGGWSNSSEIRWSGLWNVKHTDTEPELFLNTFERLVEKS